MIKKCMQYCFTAACAVGLLGTAHSQMEEEGLQFLLFQEAPVVSSQGFFKRATTQAPGYATVITDYQLARTPAMTIVDAINYYVPGMNSSLHEYSGPIFGVRGVVVDSNAKTLFMLDGQHLNHRQHFGYSTELKVPLIGDIAKLEVVNGPGAIVHGSGAISGFVNMIPKNGTDHAGLSGKAVYGFEEKLSIVEAGYGMNFGEEMDLYLYAGFVQSDGTKSDLPWDFDAVNRPTLIHESNGMAPFTLQNDTDVRVFEDTYKLGAYLNHGIFSLNVFYRQEEIDAGGFMYSTTNAGGLNPHAHTASFGIRPKFEFTLSETESLDLIGSMFWAEQAALPSRDTSDSIALPDLGSSEEHREMKAVFKTTRFENHSLAIGGSYGEKEFTATDQHFGDDVEGNWEGNTGDWDEISLFAEDVIDITEKLVLSLGMRYDEATYGPVETANNAKLPDTDHTSYRAALAYSFDDDTSLKFSYQEGFRYLDMAYMFWWSQDNALLESLGFSGIPPFEPETMTSMEVTFSKKFADKRLKFDITLFYNTYEDMLSWHNFSVANPASVSPAGVAAVLAAQGWMGSHINAVGEFSSQGVEIVGDWQPVDNLLLRGSYSFTQPESVDNTALTSISLFTNDGDEWIRYPQHLFKGLASYSLMDNALHLSVAFQYQTGVDDGNAPFNIHPTYGDDRFVADIAAEYIVNDQLSLKLTVKNLFGSEEVPQTFKNLPAMGALGEELTYTYLTANFRFG